MTTAPDRYLHCLKDSSENAGVWHGSTITAVGDCTEYKRWSGRVGWNATVASFSQAVTDVSSGAYVFYVNVAFLLRFIYLCRVFF